MEENKLLRSPARERFENGLSKELKCNHGRDRISWKAKEIFPLRFGVSNCDFRRGSPRDASKYDRLPGLNLRTGEKEFRLEIGQHLFHQVVLPHGDPASEEQHIGFQPFRN